ncbi:MAG: hypothetical protein PHP44_11480 [Kiritimatiellae bacterium]|nr:hypothetical protein [Kiritimatiellia bacterium]
MNKQHTLNKKTILNQILVRLEEELLRKRQAVDEARAEATDEETRAENEYDTRGLESSYLARGHALQFEALAADVQSLRAMTMFVFTNKPLDVGALAEVELNGEKMLFFLLPCAGGTTVVSGGREITVITPDSPMGSKLLNRKEGDVFSLRAGSDGRVLAVF